MQVLVVPPAAVRDDQSIEVLRAWIAEGALHCSLNVGRYIEDGGPELETRAWGVLLADAAQHIADALASEGHGERDNLLRAVISSFDSEIGSPSSERGGEFVAKSI